MTDAIHWIASQTPSQPRVPLRLYLGLIDQAGDRWHGHVHIIL